ncbi:hypothetical protein A5630_28200 [Mycolicibacterium mucogenicum]|uniref:Lipase n=1 Tax=Mycolicibacterium mucogenicum TaxID=56689 RepID=A0A1A3GTB2_MYCMU|nr:lipase family protein [Mycolicibacterium mucogenicum]OBJ39090.1 hypothetical protein A5630_28200 [Mycolicibacterium mucogenicum]
MLRALALLSAMLVALTGCGGTSPKASQPTPSATSSTSTDDPSSAPLTNVVPTVRDAAASMHVVTHVSRSGVNDGGTHVSTSVFVPKSNPPAGGYPIVALAHQTTGLSAECAPSQSDTLFGLAPTVEGLLRAGYVVTVPDYQGLGKPAVTDDEYNHYYPYLDSATAGYNVIDAVRATHATVPQTSTSWVALGFREGGQAAWAANELTDGYGSDLKFLGSASISPIVEVNGLADAAQNGTLTDAQKVVYIRYLAAIGREYQYDIELDDYRRGAAGQQWEAMLSCRPDAPTAPAQITAADLRPADEKALAALRAYLKKTNLPQGPALAPMLVIYGEADPVSPAAWTDRALDAACKMGDSIAIQKRPGPQTDPLAALAWIGDRFAGAPTPNDCGGRK